MPGNHDGEEIAARRSISDHRRRLRNLLLILSKKETASQIPDQDRLVMAGASTGLNEKKKGFAAAAFKGLGCTTSPAQVYAPSTATAVAAAAVRSSADWQGKKSRRKKSKVKKGREQQPLPPVRKNQTAAVTSVADIWCAPGLGLSGGDASIDCIPPSYQQSQSRGRVPGVELDRIQREDRYFGRRRLCQEPQLSSLLDSPESPFVLPLFGSDLVPASHLHRMRRIRRSPRGLDEIDMFQASLMLGELDLHDRYRDWRLDVDDMSYEELLDLGERIGYVNAGLSEEDIHRCSRKMKHFVFKASQTHFSTELQRKCCICQEDYEMNDEVGELDCAHSYHLCCIKRWLLIKNACPVCKSAVLKS